MKRYELDTIGHLYASTISEKYNPIFKIQVNLTDTVDASLLQQAVDELSTRYPYLYVGLKKGVFSAYLEESDEQLKVACEQAPPLKIMNTEEVGHFCMRILYGEKYIALEVVHVLTDGYGARVFLIAILHRYLELRHGIRWCVPIVLDGEDNQACSPKKELSEEETEDAYAKHAGQTTKRPKGEKVFRQLKERTQKEYIQNMVSEYVEGMRNPVVKRIPLIIKDRLIDYLYAKTSIERACTCISNLGNFALPEDMSPYIDNVYFGMGAERILPNNCCVTSFKGNTNICFTRTIEEPALEEEFFRRMQEMGMKISMREWQ